MTKKLSILGSTGSIGENTLLVADNLGEQIDILYLSANRNVERLIEQAQKYYPKTVAIVDSD